MSKSRLKKKPVVEIDPEEIEFEPEGEPDEPQLDTVFKRDGRGKVYVMEVPDDD